MKLNAYLSYKGNCEAAFNAYAKILGGKVEGMFTWGSSPMAGQVPADFQGKVMHATLVIGDNVLMGADSPPGHEEDAKGISISINLTEVAEAERIFNALADNGEVQMPLQQTFWASRFGMLRDKWGIPWMINCGQPT